MDGKRWLRQIHLSTIVVLVVLSSIILGLSFYDPDFGVRRNWIGFPYGTLNGWEVMSCEWAAIDFAFLVCSLLFTATACEWLIVQAPRRRFLLISVFFLVLSAGSVQRLCERWQPWGIERIIEPGPHTIRSAACSPDGKYILAGDDFGIGYLIDAKSGERLMMFGEAPASRPTAQLIPFTGFMPGSKRVLFGLDESLSSYDVETGKKLADFKGRALLGFSVDDKRAFFLKGDYWTTGLTISECNIENGSEVGTWPIPKGIGWPVLLFPDGRKVITTKSGGIAWVLDLSTGKHDIRLSTDGLEILSTKISKDSKEIITLTSKGTRQVWDAATGAIKAISYFKSRIDADWLAFSKDEAYFVATNGMRSWARIWSTERHSLIATLQSAYLCQDAIFTSDGQRVITFGGDTPGLCIWFPRVKFPAGVEAFPEFWLAVGCALIAGFYVFRLITQPR